MRLIDADVLKKKVTEIYKHGSAKNIAVALCMIVDDIPTLDFRDDDIMHLVSEFDGIIYDTKTAKLVCTIDPCMADKSSQFLMRTENGDYFTCKARNRLVNHIDCFDLKPTTLDDADDYIMEFYPDEYDRVHEIIENERKKNGKDRSISHESLN